MQPAEQPDPMRDRLRETVLQHPGDLRGKQKLLAQLHPPSPHRE